MTSSRTPYDGCENTPKAALCNGRKRICTTTECRWRPPYLSAHVDQRQHLGQSVLCAEGRTWSMLRLFLSAERSQTTAGAVLRRRHPRRHWQLALSRTTGLPATPQQVHENKPCCRFLHPSRPPPLIGTF